MKDRLLSFVVHGRLCSSSLAFIAAAFILSSPFLAQPVRLMLPFSLSPAGSGKQFIRTMTTHHD
jgi:hypothetical protein